MCTEQRNRPCKPRLSGLFCVVQVQGFLRFRRKKPCTFPTSIMILVGKNTVYNACILQKPAQKSRFLQIPTAMLWEQVATATYSADIKIGFFKKRQFGSCLSP